MTQIIPDIINIVIEAIFAILGLFFTGVAIPWLIKTGIPWLKDKRLYGIVTVLVKAAEKQREAGTLTIPKYDYVVQMLEAKGIKVTAEVKAMIEAAVKELDIAVDSTIGTLGGIFAEEMLLHNADFVGIIIRQKATNQTGGAERTRPDTARAEA